MYRLATKCTEKSNRRQREHERCKQREASIRTARRMPCRRYDRLSHPQLSFFFLLLLLLCIDLHTQGSH